MTVDQSLCGPLTRDGTANGAKSGGMFLQRGLDCLTLAFKAIEGSAGFDVTDPVSKTERLIEETRRFPDRLQGKIVHHSVALKGARENRLDATGKGREFGGEVSFRPGRDGDQVSGVGVAHRL